MSNVVIWNSIHHKTNVCGGTSAYGYPDDTYFNRVKNELAANGVMESDIDSTDMEKLEQIANKFTKKMRKVKTNSRK